MQAYLQISSIPFMILAGILHDYFGGFGLVLTYVLIGIGALLVLSVEKGDH